MNRINGSFLLGGVTYPKRDLNKKTWRKERMQGWYVTQYSNSKEPEKRSISGVVPHRGKTQDESVTCCREGDWKGELPEFDFRGRVQKTIYWHCRKN